MPMWKWCQFGNNVVPYLFVQLYTCQDPKNSSGVYRPKKKKNALLACLAQRLSAVEVRNGYGRATGVGAAPRRRRSNEAIWSRIPVPRIVYWGRDEKKLLTEKPPKKNDYIHITRAPHGCRHSPALMLRVGQGSTSNCSIQYLVE